MQARHHFRSRPTPGLDLKVLGIRVEGVQGLRARGFGVQLEASKLRTGRCTGVQLRLKV